MIMRSYWLRCEVRQQSSPDNHPGWLRLKIVDLLTIIVISLFSATAGASSAPKIILDNQNSYQLSGYFEQLVDPTGEMTLADLLTPAVSAHFVAIAGNMNRSYTSDTVWLRFTVQRTQNFPADAWLRLTPPYLDQITVFQQRGEDPAQPSAYQSTQLGDNIPAAQRSCQNIDFVAPLLLPADIPTIVYLQVRSTSTVCLEGYIHTHGDLIRQGSSTIMYQGGYFGIALIIALINLVIFVRIRDRIFLFFSLYILAICINHLAIQGMLPLIWPDSAHLVSHYLIGMSTGSVLIILCCFLSALFDTPRFPWVHRYLMLVALLGVLTMVSVPLNFYATMMSLTIVGLITTLLLMLWLSSGAIRRGEPAGMIYLLAFGISSFAYIAHVLRMLGLIPLAWWNIHTIQFATLLNMVLMTLALTERLHTAEKKAMQAVRESEQKAVELAHEMTGELRDALTNEKQIIQRQTRFLSMLSHEYRTPLAIIQANLNLLELEERANTGNIRIVNTMKHALSRLVELLEVSLQHEKLGNFAREPQREKIELTGLIDEVIDKAEGFWPERTFIFTPSQSAKHTVIGEPSQLRTALLNLLDNACKYSPDDLPIMLITRSTDGHVEVDIVDQGSGVAPDEVSSLFEKHYRGKNSKNIIGSGLGLWIVHQTIKNHGGSISIEPGNKVGTCARLILPTVTS